MEVFLRLVGLPFSSEGPGDACSSRCSWLPASACRSRIPQRLVCASVISSGVYTFPGSDTLFLVSKALRKLKEGPRVVWQAEGQGN